MTEQEVFKRTKYALQSSLIIGNRNLIKILIAINANRNRMIKEDIEKITELTSEVVNDSINILEKSNYIETFMEDVPGRSPHKICALTNGGRELIKILGIQEGTVESSD